MDDDEEVDQAHLSGGLFRTLIWLTPLALALNTAVIWGVFSLARCVLVD